MDLLEDLSILSTIPIENLDKLKDEFNLCIYNSIYEQILNKQDIISLDLDIGQLILKIENDNIKYKFIPNEEFQQNIINMFLTKNNPLKVKIYAKLKNKICNTYKDLF